MTIRHYILIVAVVVTTGCDHTELSAPSTQSAGDAEPKVTAEESTPMAIDWPFRDAENTAVITLSRIMNKTNSILYVVHDEDGDWQFLDGGDVSEEDAATVSLKNVTELDPSVKSLADLPAGWAAERSSIGQEWKRFQR